MMIPKVVEMFNYLAYVTIWVPVYQTPAVQSFSSEQWEKLAMTFQ